MKRITLLLWLSTVPVSLSATHATCSYERRRDSVEEKIRLGTREFLASTLEAIFSSSNNAHVSKTIAELIRAELSPYGGGPCDRYDDCPVSPPFNEPSPNGESQAPGVPTATTPRFGLIERVCDLIAFDDQAISSAVNRATGAAQNINHLPDDAMLGKAFQLFHPGANPTPAVSGELRKIADEAAKLGGEREAWRFVFHTLCLSPSWQIP